MYPEPKVDLSVEFCGVRFAHPFILAAAPLDEGGDKNRRGAELIIACLKGI